MRPLPILSALAALVLPALILSACSATQSRIDAHEDVFVTYPPEVQEAIRENRLLPGFDATQVYLALGDAHARSTDGDVETWSYHRTHKRWIQEDKPEAQHKLELVEFQLTRVEGANTPAPRSFDDVCLARTAVELTVQFVDGEVVQWDEPTDVWVDEWHEVARR
jgi:outer membrane protein assembly factor BamE (lipoprotein component of BamABCDE complex)